MSPTDGDDDGDSDNGAPLSASASKRVFFQEKAGNE